MNQAVEEEHSNMSKRAEMIPFQTA